MSADTAMSAEALDRAWAQVRSELAADPLPDPAAAARFAGRWPRVRARLLADLAHGRYRPRPFEIAQVPKGGGAHRPVPLLGLADRVVYAALVGGMAARIDAALDDHVFSNRLDAQGRRRHSGGREWIRFEGAARALHRDHGGRALLDTDVSGFFENFDTAVLAADLAAVNAPGDRIEGLLDFLTRLTAGSALRGLPHDQDASAILGNLYLAPVDRLLRGQGLGFVRYLDDIKVFAPEAGRLHSARQAVEDVLGARGMTLAPHKTELREGDAVLAGLTPLGDDPRVLFDRAVADGPVRRRELRFSLALLGRAGDAHAVPWVAQRLGAMPEFASHFAGYLLAVLPPGPPTAGPWPAALDRLYALLAGDAGGTGEAVDVHPYTAFHLLRVLTAMPGGDRRTAPLLQRFADGDAYPGYLRRAAGAAPAAARPDAAARGRAVSAPGAPPGRTGC
ncbi:hypothetical protein FKN01_13435 [Streptomyces sp. 130]|uniref:RNA-directed DNA polymerase n=1 Tax=Streptomyces sp. 130 TaxID=2591006 RepID=UPI00117CEFB2|nr:RNA-directed DNA polymerase [Streptomyces sp. 130]TRV78303.1 hypothetical protein FKN01_13435 [Streptomyces sp. 130]